VREYFRPEFLNRLDEVVMFNALDAAAIEKILRMMLKKESKLAADRALTLTFTDAAVGVMLGQYDEPEYGARPLRRIIQRSVREPLADFLLKANPPAGTEIKVDGDESGLTFALLKDGEEIKIS
jgi:ATP-dependent Clp protease ATP-binding subunit ClpA